MKLKKLALFAEIGSSIAVLITLIFLVSGIRENANATQAAVYEDLLDGINRFNLVLINDGELAQLWSNRQTISLNAMEADNAARLVYMNRVIFRIFDAAYFSFRNGSLDDSQWLRFRDNACRIYSTDDASPELRDLWLETEEIVSREYVSYLEESCVN